MRTRLIAVLCAVGAVMAGTAYAQPGGGCESYPCLPNGTPLTCTLQPNGTKIWVDASGNTYGSNTQGTGTFQVSNCLPANCTTELTPTSIKITSNAGQLGVITTTLDASRSASVSTLASLAPGQLTPATEDFYFYANATVSSFPGKSFRSIQELHFFSPQVNTFNPHVGEKFKLVNPVDFEDVNVPGVVVFTLQNTEIALN